jgi:hypothetical protein
MPSFKRILEAIAESWRDERDKVFLQGDKVVEAISRQVPSSDEPLTEELLRDAYEGIRQAFDPEWGGFGAAPKFPQPMTLELLLRCDARGWEGAIEMVTVTLDRMARGGMYDQLGGGFHRYSTDRTWLVPHFEKMLYDNAQLARLYTHAWQVSREESFARIARETLAYLLREMRDPHGGFYSAQDADSEGVEGKFFVWSWEDLVTEAGEDAAEALGGTPDGNWEGTNILWQPDARWRADGDARRRLLELREKRPRPATDDKVLASWNGLAISAFAVAGRVLGEPGYVDAAGSAADFVLSELRRSDGRLLRSWRDGRTSGPAYLDDYALLAAACLDLYETTFHVRWFEQARTLADDMLRLFRDDEGGGFFQTGSDAERLVIRPKELFDNAVPAGNSVAAEILQRIALFTGDAGYEEAAVSALGAVRDLLTRAPTGFGHALGALDLHVSASKEIAIAGDPDSKDARALIGEVWRRYLPNTVLAVARPGDDAAVKAIPLLEGREPLDGKAAAYVCERFVCRRPVTEPEELATSLD